MKSKRGTLVMAAMFIVLLISGCGGGGDSSSGPGAPVAPTGVTATAGHGEVSITWSAVTGATSYNIYYSQTTGVTKVTGNKIAGVTSPSIVPALTNGTTYYFVVTAVNAAGESVESSQVSAIPTFAPPAAPTNVSATPGPVEATIRWDNVAGVTSYNIYYSTTSGVTKVNGSSLTNRTSPTIVTGLTNGTTYYFVVTSVNAAGEGVESTQVSATPTPNPPPPAPTGLTGAAGVHEVSLNWTAVTGATSYNIYFDNTTPVTKATINKVTGITTSTRIVTGLANGTTYYFRVTALNANGESDVSNEFSAIPNPFPAPPAPTDVTATAGPGNATINWPTVTGATSYNIYYSTTNGVTKATGTKVAGVTSGNTVTGLIRGATYYFVVTALNSDGVESLDSNQASAIPNPPNPSYSQADLTGIWNIRVIRAGTTAGWYSVTASVDSSGNVSVLDSGGTDAPPTIPILSIASGGEVTETGGNATFHGKMSTSKNLIVGTSTTVGDANTFGLHVFVKRVPGVNFSNTDLENITFNYNRLYTGTSEKWENASGSTNGTRQITLSVTDNTGSVASPMNGSTFSVNSAGIVAIGAEPSFSGVMSPDKKIIVGTSTDAAGTFSLRIIQVGGQTFSQADLVGSNITHTFHCGEPSAWAYATWSTDSSGDTTFVSFLNSDGGTDLGAPFKLTITPQGFVNNPLNPDSVGGWMSFGKDMVVRVLNATDGASISITMQ